ncbi:lysine biosynthesis protein LysW [Candidatus Roizmanbacteria bacterium]|nr:lysine biosynthesis protein LysW [Candidatus Roizmanbacteria bacterium]
MANKQTQILCPDCEGNIILDNTTEKGEVISCKDCSVQLEVVSLQPIKVNLAPKLDEDWGE